MYTKAAIPPFLIAISPRRSVLKRGEPGMRLVCGFAVPCAAIFADPASRPLLRLAGSFRLDQ